MTATPGFAQQGSAGESSLLSREGVSKAIRAVQSVSKPATLIAGAVGALSLLLPWATVADGFTSTHGHKNGFGWVYETSDAMGNVINRAHLTLPGWIIGAALGWILLTTIIPGSQPLSARTSMWSRVAASGVAVALTIVAFDSINAWVDWYNMGIEHVAPGAPFSATFGFGPGICLAASLTTLIVSIADLVADKSMPTTNHTIGHEEPVRPW